MKKWFVLVAVVAMVGVCVLPAMAQKAENWSFYGSARMQTGWEATDFGDNVAVGSREDDFDAKWDLQGNARIGANVKHDGWGGKFEYGSGPNLRLLYGTYTTGDFEVLVGQTYPPTSKYFYSNQIWNSDNDLLDCGQFYAGRRPVVQGSIKGFSIALVKPTAPAEVAGSKDMDVIIPRIEFCYNLKADSFFFDVYGGYNLYTVDYEVKKDPGTSVNDDINVNSGVFGIGGGFTMDPIFIKGGMHVGQNLGPNGYVANPRGNSNPEFVTKNGKTDIEDCLSYGGLFVFGVKASDMITIETGAGYLVHDIDLANVEKDDTLTAYLNATVNIHKNFFIVPEVGYVDNMENRAGVDEGSIIYGGAKWQINF